MPIQVDPACTAYSDADAAVRQLLEAQAVWLLWALSGRTFGLQMVKVRPVQPWPSLPTNRPSWPYGHYPLMPALSGPLPLLGGGFTDERAIAFLEGPITEVLQVTVDGQVVDPSAYTVFDSYRLVRTDGNVWPWQQRLTDPDTDEGTFAVTYTRGNPLPPSGQIAAGLIVCELAKARALDPTCQLPERVQKVSREGLDVQFLDPQDFVKDGRTGITAVDQWLHAVNPAGIASGADVWSPDLPYNHRVPTS
jgi:hypothetical protein